MARGFSNGQEQCGQTQGPSFRGPRQVGCSTTVVDAEAYSEEIGGAPVDRAGPRVSLAGATPLADPKRGCGGRGDYKDRPEKSRDLKATSSAPGEPSSSFPMTVSVSSSFTFPGRRVGGPAGKTSSGKWSGAGTCDWKKHEEAYKAWASANNKKAKRQRSDIRNNLFHSSFNLFFLIFFFSRLFFLHD